MTDAATSSPPSSRAGWPRSLTGNVFLLGNRYLSLYLVRGRDGAALIEAGLSATAGQAVEQIEGLGLDLREVRWLLISHPHPDHCSGAGPLKERLPWLEVLASSETGRLLAKDKIQRLFSRDDGLLSARLIELEAAKGPLPELKPLSAGLIDRLIEPGQVVDLGGVSLRVLDAPGHAPGGLAFFEPRGRLLFCSDSLGFPLLPDLCAANFYVDLDDYLATFETLVGLEPAWLCPGHCGAYSGPEMNRLIDLSRQEIAWIVQLARDEVRGPDIPAAAVEKLVAREHIRECTLFSPEMMRYLSALLIQRALDSRLLSRPGRRPQSD